MSHVHEADWCGHSLLKIFVRTVSCNCPDNIADRSLKSVQIEEEPLSRCNGDGLPGCFRVSGKLKAGKHPAEGALTHPDADSISFVMLSPWVLQAP